MQIVLKYLIKAESISKIPSYTRYTSYFYNIFPCGTQMIATKKLLLQSNRAV